MDSFLPLILSAAAGVGVFFVYRMVKGRGVAGAGILIGGRRAMVLMHTKANSLVPISATKIGPAFLTREYGGFLEMEGHAATLRFGHPIFRKPSNDLEADAMLHRTTVYLLREVDARPLFLQGGAEAGYTGRKAGRRELKIVEDLAAQRAESEAVAEGSTDEQAIKLLMKGAIASVIVALLVWVALFGFTAYKGVSVL